MAGLILKLSPNERILINGVVMENGDRKATIKIKTPDAAILRLRDALHPDDVKTPVTRAYYTAQLVVAGSADTEPSAARLTAQLQELGLAFEGTPHAETIAKAIESLRGRNFYSVMRVMRPLIAVESELLSGGERGREPGEGDAGAPKEKLHGAV